MLGLFPLRDYRNQLPTIVLSSEVQNPLDNKYPSPSSLSRGRVVLVGDAGYSVALASGQGTTVAMVGAYVLAGELASHEDDLTAGIPAYESELRDYVLRNQDDVLKISLEPQSMPGGEPDAKEDGVGDGFSDFGKLVQPIGLKDYSQFVKRQQPQK